MSLGLSFSAHSGYFANIDLEINSIKRDCLDRAEKQMEKNYKEFNEIMQRMDMVAKASYDRHVLG